MVSNELVSKEQVSNDVLSKEMVSITCTPQKLCDFVQQSPLSNCY